MSRIAQIVFAVLVAATFGAFFVAQRLKNGPTLVQKFNRDPVFSPNKDGRLDRAAPQLPVKKEDDVTVDVVDTKGDRVKRLADNRRLTAYTGMFLSWDGTTDDGRSAPDGTYRTRDHAAPRGPQRRDPEVLRARTPSRRWCASRRSAPSTGGGARAARRHATASR